MCNTLNPVRMNSNVDDLIKSVNKIKLFFYIPNQVCMPLYYTISFTPTGILHKKYFANLYLNKIKLFRSLFTESKGTCIIVPIERRLLYDHMARSFDLYIGHYQHYQLRHHSL